LLDRAYLATGHLSVRLDLTGKKNEPIDAVVPEPMMGQIRNVFYRDGHERFHAGATEPLGHGFEAGSIAAHGYHQLLT
jgi:hypothetical protein